LTKSDRRSRINWPWNFLWLNLKLHQLTQFHFECVASLIKIINLSSNKWFIFTAQKNYQINRLCEIKIAKIIYTDSKQQINHNSSNYTSLFNLRMSYYGTFLIDIVNKLIDLLCLHNQKFIKSFLSSHQPELPLDWHFQWKILTRVRRRKINVQGQRKVDSMHKW
jgi:hypothetical protein